MSERDQQLPAILHHIDRIESELRLLRQVIRNLISDDEEGDQDLILVEAEPIVLGETVDPYQVPRTVTPEASRTLT